MYLDNCWLAIPVSALMHSCMLFPLAPYISLSPVIKKTTSKPPQKQENKTTPQQLKKSCVLFLCWREEDQKKGEAQNVKKAEKYRSCPAEY